MRRQGGGFGFVILLVVLAIVFYVAMRNMQAVAPAAMDIQKHNARRRVEAQTGLEPADTNQTPSPSASSDSWTPTPPSRPNLEKMDKATTQHTDAVKDSLSQAN
jgi:hypothetical protein